MARSEQKSDSLNLKSFNSTGNDETTTDVLRQHVSPATKRRNATMLFVVALAVALLGYVAYQRSGLALIPQAETGRSFGSAADAASREQKPE